jgi:hypothetical protein
MGTRQLRILPYTGKRAYQYYIDGLKVNGKRQRLFFKDEKSATAKLKELTKKTRKEGEDALALSHDFRVLAAKCSERLKPSQPSRYKRLPDYGQWRYCAWNGRMSISSADSLL